MLRRLLQRSYWLGLIATFLFFSACESGRGVNRSSDDKVVTAPSGADSESAGPEPFSSVELVEAVAKLDNMTQLDGECLSNDLPADSKLRANLVVAWRVSATPDDIVLHAYERIQDESPHELLHDPGKLLIINRLVFDVPGSYPSNWQVTDGDVSPRFWFNTPVDENGINYLFPFEIDKAGLLCCLPTSHLRDFVGSGAAYIDAADEYRFFSENFHKRDLSVYLVTGD